MGAGTTGRGGVPLSATPARSPVVVLEPGRFTACALGSNAFTPISLDELVAMAEQLPEPDAVQAGAHRPLADERPDIEVGIVRGRARAAIVGGGAAWVHLDSEGAWLRLGPDHLAALVGTDSLASTRRSALLTDLAVTGVVDVEERAVSAEPEPEVEPAIEPEPAPDVVVGDDPRPAWHPRRLAGRARRWLRHTHQARAVETTPPPAEPEPAPEPPPEAVPERRRPADGRVPVFQFWATDHGPHLGAASIVAYARVHDGGALNAGYDLRRAAPAAEVLAELATLDGPAVVLCSNYVWSTDPNLAFAAEALACNPEVVAVHGGPSTPKYEEDLRRFLVGRSGAHAAVQGEGEITFAAVLEALAGAWALPVEQRLSVLDGVEGVRYVDPATGRLVMNPDRERHAELADFPSPFGSGELADVDDEVLHSERVLLPVETNRGCPYGCSFCDWGSATMSRIRKFPIERVREDLAWLADHRIDSWIMADANFGILPRDPEIAEEVARLKAASSYPSLVGIAAPKTLTDRFVEILDTILGAGITMRTSLALQTRDDETLAAIERRNIKTETYDALAVKLRQRGLPVTSDIMVGLPGATIASLKADLQWHVDHQVRPFFYPTALLPNAPMNDPEYRTRFQIRSTSGSAVAHVVATSSYSPEERRTMDRITYAFQCFEVHGILRHVLRVLQWDRGRLAVDVVQDIVELVDADPADHPLTAWLLRQMDLFFVPPVGWAPLLAELRSILVDDLGIADGTDLDTAFAVSLAVLPAPRRRFPQKVALDHDYVAYFRSATGNLLLDGRPGEPDRPLAEHGPAELTIHDDPDRLGEDGYVRFAEERDVLDVGYNTAFWFPAHLELVSPFALFYQPISPTFVQRAREFITEGELLTS